MRQAPANSGGSPALRDEGGDVRHSRRQIAVEALQGLETHDHAVSDCDETTDAMGTNDEPLRELRAGQRSVDRGLAAFGNDGVQEASQLFCIIDLSVAKDRKSTRLNSSHVSISY